MLAVFAMRVTQVNKSLNRQCVWTCLSCQKAKKLGIEFALTQFINKISSAQKIVRCK